MNQKKHIGDYLPIPLSLFGLAVLLSLPLFAPGNQADARSFRSGNWIKTPKSVDKLAPEGAQQIDKRRPVDPKLVKRAVYALFEAWNTGQLDPLLDERRFFNKDRLLDTLNEVAPRQAELKVMSIGNISTLKQYLKPVNGRRKQVSIVSTVVRSQIEFQDANNQQIRIEGRNEFVLEISQPAIGG